MQAPRWQEQAPTRSNHMHLRTLSGDSSSKLRNVFSRKSAHSIPLKLFAVTVHDSGSNVDGKSLLKRRASSSNRILHIGVGRGGCLLHSLRMLPHPAHQFYVAVIERTGGNYFPLTNLLRVIHEKNTIAPRAVYTKLHSVTCFFRI
jgi:hypothetical protein